MSYGPILPLETAPRYTSLLEVKKSLNINDTSLDDEVNASIIAAELAIDRVSGRSLPDLPLVEPIHGDEIDGITETRRQWALSASIGVLKLRDTNTGGSDEWLGAIEFSAEDQARSALRRNPLALGEAVSFGAA